MSTSRAERSGRTLGEVRRSSVCAGGLEAADGRRGEGEVFEVRERRFIPCKIG
jgi:hypothetical protein